MKNRYSPEFRASLVQKIATPGGPSIMQMSEKLGVPHVTIRNWIKLHGNSNDMKKTKEWSAEQRLEALIKTAAMSEGDRGEYLRANGLHSADLEAWKQDFYSSQRAAGRPKLDRELVQLRSKEKELSKDLRRKDRALAEMSARVILLKKSRAIFGESEDDE